LFVSDWIEKSALPLDMTVRPAGNGWEVSVNNSLDRSLPGVRAVLGGRLCTLGDVPASQTKTFTVKAGQGHGHERDGAVLRTALSPGRAVPSISSFGNNATSIPDTMEGATAASFLSYINTGDGQTWNNSPARPPWT
jgi:hypothetical protein